MTDILQMRARRFDALYQLLTGAAHAELPTPFDGTDHPRKDVGLPERQWSRADGAPIWLFPIHPYQPLLQRRPGQ